MRKNKKTLEQYKDMGAKFRVFKTMACQLSVDASQFLTSKQWAKRQKAVDSIGAYAAPIEDKMFRDYPELTNEYVDVFYGATDNETRNEARNEVDADVVDRAKKFCENLF